MKKYFAALFLALTTFDMGVKSYVEENFVTGEKREAAIPKVVFRKIHNKGFCLNAFDKYPALVKSISALLCGGLGVKASHLFGKRGRWIEKLGMTLLGAGAFSNTFDRLIRGYVVDYFGIKINNSKLSKITANLADLYILTGVSILTVSKEKRGKV